MKGLSRKNQLTQVSFPKKTVSECCNSQLHSKSSCCLKSSPTVLSAHTGLSQELKNLSISKNHVGQTRYTSKPGNGIDAIEKFEAEDQFIKTPKTYQHPKIPLSEDSLQNQEETPADCPKKPSMSKCFKQSGNNSRGLQCFNGPLPF